MDSFESFAPPTSTLSRFHETSAKFQRYKVLLRRRWWFLLLTVAIAICYETLDITGKATQYISLGKIAATVKIEAGGASQSPVVDDMRQAEFFGTQIEILEGGDLKHRALERVRGLHPELKEVEVDIRVTQTKGSGILKVAAVGEEQKYTRVYLEALLDEYMAFRQEMVDKSIGNAMNKVIEDVISRQKAMSEKYKALTDFLKNNDLSLFQGDRNQSATYLKQLEVLRDEYETELLMMNKMGQYDYLQSKDKAGGGATAQLPLPNAGLKESGALTSGNGPDVTGGDLGGGLTRSEADYLKALNDLKMLQSERAQLLQIYRPAHDMIREIDDKITKQDALIKIMSAASVEEWDRRKRGIQAKIEALGENIKVAEGKAREANDKIVTHKSLEEEYKRASEEYQGWQKTLDNLQNALKLQNDFVSIIERPQQAVKDEPDLLKPLLWALFIGLGAGSVVLFLFDRLDDRMNSFSEFQALFPNESILGQIPEQHSRGDVSLIRPNDDRHLYAEAFRNLRSSILFKNWKNGRPPKLILFTSAVPNEGKTTTVANLAVTMALGGARVLLADADLRRGGVNELFKAPATPGLAEVLTSKLHWRDAVQETATKNLHILPRGEALDQTSELFLAPLTQEILNEMGEEYDYVVFDSAPTLVADDTASFAPKVDTVLFIVRMSSTMARLTAKALDTLYDRQVSVGGVILNRASTNLKEYTYYNYASYYSISARKNAQEKGAGA